MNIPLNHYKSHEYPIKSLWIPWSPGKMMFTTCGMIQEFSSDPRGLLKPRQTRRESARDACFTIIFGEKGLSEND